MQTTTGRTGPTSARVLAAATALFAEKGFHGSGIRELAGRAGLSSASLYHWTGTKEDLLRRIMVTSLDRLVRAARETAEAHPDPVDAVAGLACLHVVTHARHQDETRVVDGELRSLAPPARAEVVGLRDAYEQVWASCIAAGTAEGTLDVPSPSVARLAVLEMCTGVSRWYAQGGRLPLDDVATEHARLVLAALGAGPLRSAPAPGVLAGVHERVGRLWA